jgi:DNA (cytosine-5)-methyltransferase 1
VFVVGYLGDWRRAAAVLFERESLLGHPTPRREAGKGIGASIARSVALRGREGGGVAELGDEVGLTLRASSGGGDKAHVLIPGVARALTTSNQRIDAETETLLVAHSLRGEGFDASEDGTGRGTPIVPVADTLTSHWHQSNGASAGNNSGMINPVIHGGASVRRLTPLECERLQGFPDLYTRVPIKGGAGWAADSPRYKAVGNSMAVNVMRWLGDRIQVVDNIDMEKAA